jgi:hypothetical protein
MDMGGVSIDHAMPGREPSPPDAAGARPRAACVVLGLVGAVALAAPTAASALEAAPTYGWGPRTPFLFFPGVDERTATVAGLPPSAPAGGIDVIGDSISTGVPYVARGAQDGVRVDVRSWFGWNIRFHRSVTGWSDTALPSVEQAATDGQRAVIVQLGTNDIYCLRADEACPDTPRDGDARAEAWVAAGRAAITTQVQALAARLLDAGKCVVWAGPRAGGSLRATDVDFFDGVLADVQDAHPGRLHLVRWDTDPAVVADFADPGSDGIHPRTTAARAAIADTLVDAAEQSCGLDATPPGATIGAGPPPTARETTPAFGFTAGQPRTTFRCQVDAQASEPCTSPEVVPPQADGLHTFAVTATNAAGVSDPAPAVRAFTVDRTGPAAAFADPPRLVRTATPTLAFASLPAADAATWACRVDDRPPVPCASPFVAPPLADGVHVVTVAGQDALGNPGPAIATALRVDTLPPHLSAGPQTLRVDRHGRGLVHVTCSEADGSCSGSLVLRSAIGLGHATDSPAVRFATATVAVKAGRGRTVPFTITRSTLPLLVRRGSVAVAISTVTTDAAGNTATAITQQSMRFTTTG